MHFEHEEERISAEENKRLAQEMYGAWNRSDFDACLKNCTEDVEIIAFATTPEPKRGKTGFREQLQLWKNPFPDGKVQVVNQVAGEDGVTSECAFTGTNTEPLLSPQGEIPSTGRKVETHFVEVWKVREGKVSMLHNYADNIEMMTQLGLMPQP